jgi:hypothetical protein
MIMGSVNVRGGKGEDAADDRDYLHLEQRRLVSTTLRQ